MSHTYTSESSQKRTSMHGKSKGRKFLVCVFECKRNSLWDFLFHWDDDDGKAEENLWMFSIKCVCHFFYFIISSLQINHEDFHEFLKFLLKIFLIDFLQSGNFHTFYPFIGLQRRKFCKVNRKSTWLCISTLSPLNRDADDDKKCHLIFSPTIKKKRHKKKYSPWKLEETQREKWKC